ncbi:Na+/H+ antiporter subunit E [Microbacterium nanhaiense]|uniref:Na+/H+ antiporter subunit E n=1 Tax=Microbacterium nanhaiense TaxID=1301026 RepID=A0ABQ2N210_9MICO|nr:Na+/H+ antiporter subunit E [Microbacterium nanhaiense]GGO63748.1 Na+/H+ antiporter subunit E [Microbacterium nanhaiense]
MTTAREQVLRLWVQLPFFIWLVVLWMLLWGQLTVLAAVTGIVVAVVVTNVFRLPAAELTGRVNLWWLVVAIVAFLGHLVAGAVQVAWLATKPGRTQTAIIRSPLRIDDDLIMTHVAVALSLVPGSTVIESDRTNRVLFMHVLDVTSAEDVEKFRRGALKWEKLIVRAVGSREDLRLVTDEVPVFAERRREEAR